MPGSMLQHLARAAREARVAAGLRQIDVATSAGVSHETISRFERCEGWPLDPDAIIAAYAEELGLDPLELWARGVARWRQQG